MSLSALMHIILLFMGWEKILNSFKYYVKIYIYILSEHIMRLFQHQSQYKH